MDGKTITLKSPTSMIIEERLDALLKVLYEGDQVEAVYVAETYKYLFPSGEDEFNRDWAPYIAALEGRNLARKTERAGTVMRITPFGRDVYEAGGWVKYQAMLAEKEKREEEARREQLELERISARGTKSSARAAWIAAGISLVALLLTYLQYRNSESSLEALEQKVKSLEEKLLTSGVSERKVLPDSTRSGTKSANRK